MSKVYVKGFEEFNKNLTILPDKMIKQVHTSAVRGGAREMIKQAKRNLGAGYSTLKKSLKIKKLRTARRNIKFRVHPERGAGAKNDGWYAHIVEFGTFRQPGGYQIPSKEVTASGRRSYAVLGANAVFSKVKHPGIRPTRFMTRAKERETAIIDAMLKQGRKAFNTKIKQQWLK